MKTRPRARHCATAALAAAAIVSLVALTGNVRATPGDDGGAELFRNRVHAILERSCFECHGPLASRIRGGLLMNGRDTLLRGGDTGAALVPGDADGSALIAAVRRLDPDLAMPPRETLPPEDVAVLAAWVAAGAAWPAELVHVALPATESAPPPDTAATQPAAEYPPPDRDTLHFFESEVRPLLAQNCYECHGPALERVRGGLRFAGRPALLRGGVFGPAVVPGKPEESLLIQAVRWTDPHLSMPPDTRLSEADVATLERWVSLGAPWPLDEGTIAHDDDDAGGVDVEAGRQWWAFRPVVRPPVPVPEAAPSHPVDAFVAARLQQDGLSANPRAAPAQLVRRLHFDLLGLPPTRAEVDAFAETPGEPAWARLVDELLARPEYGERWARHWLDIVRYAQSDGYEKDAEKPYAWRYRDYVVRSFAADKPYDRFLQEQLAGDELDEPTDDAILATGFWRLGLWDSEPDDPGQALWDERDDHVRTITEGMLGVTLGCARCHDHKTDPFSQEDYYSMVALVANVRGYGEPRFTLDSPTLRPLGFNRPAAAGWEATRKQALEELRAERRALHELGRERSRLAREAAAEDARAAAAAAAATAPGAEAADHTVPPIHDLQLDYDERQRLFALNDLIDKPLARFSHEGNLDWALSVSEAQLPVADTHLLVRGRATSPAQVVPPRFVRVLCASDEQALPGASTASRPLPSSGRRRALAEWITDPAHPTTARVAVNRIWQHHFGRGLVETPDDFGATGIPPSHPELLDWLAAEFVDSGWSFKHIHRLILTSETWRRSSTADNPPAIERDPGNRLLWRQNLRRLEAEALRDAMLFVAGRLDSTPGGRGFFPRLSREALAGGSRPGLGWELSTPEEQNRRTLYTFVKRSQVPPLLEVFDFTNTSLPVGTRNVTTLASQALMLLNGEFAGEMAAALAERVRQRAGHDARARVETAFELALARAPEAEELAIASAALAEQQAAFETLPAQLAFRSLLPSRVDIGFLELVRGEDALFGPRQGWSYLPGTWGTPYNRTRTVELDAGPVALLDGAPFADGTLQARVAFRAGCELGALLLRAAPAPPGVTGVEAVFRPAAGEVRLVLHSAGAAPRVLGQAAVALPAESELPLRFSVQGTSAKLWLGDQTTPLLSVQDEALPAGGQFGVRAWGDTFRMRDVVLTADGEARTLLPDDQGSPADRALIALCLALLNLNEFVHVD